jgi:coenzyme Q-binding protein COQ10
MDGLAHFGKRAEEISVEHLISETLVEAFDVPVLHRLAGLDVMEADLVISFKVFRERFGSRVTLWPEMKKIDTEYIDGPFKHMKSTWSFRDVEGGCEVDFFVDFEFRNAILQGIIGVVFNDAMQRVVRAFERRAAELHGPKV